MHISFSGIHALLLLTGSLGKRCSNYSNEIPGAHLRRDSVHTIGIETLLDFSLDRSTPCHDMSHIDLKRDTPTSSRIVTVHASMSLALLNVPCDRSKVAIVILTDPRISIRTSIRLGILHQHMLKD